MLDKLRNDVKLEMGQRQQAEEALAQAMAGVVLRRRAPHLLPRMPPSNRLETAMTGFHIPGPPAPNRPNPTPADFHDMKAQMLDLRLRQQRLRRVISHGHETLEKALRLNQVRDNDREVIAEQKELCLCRRSRAQAGRAQQRRCELYASSRSCPALTPQP